MILCKKVLMTISALSMIVMLMLSSISIVVFGKMDYYRHEFEKYNVTQNIDMSMDNVMYVMNELMDYLHNDRDSLEHIVTVVNGQKRDFFSEREKIHMADCKEIFNNALVLRKICTMIFIILTLAMILMKMFDIRQFIKICGMISIGIILFASVVTIAALINFDASFTMFHKIFFDNDLWLLYPETDLIINILVEDFFRDIAIKIGIYSMSIPAVLAVSGTVLYFSDRKRRYV